MIILDSYFFLETFTHRELFEGIEYPWMALLELKKFFKSRVGKIACPIPKGVTLVHPELISIGEGSMVEAGAYIVGPCVFGKECQIRHGAYIRGNVVAGDRCVIGHATEVKESILLDGAAAPHFNYVGNSILGNGVNLGAGVVCANVRLDGEEVAVLFEGQRILTGMKKFGALVGDGSKLGANCVLNPGTLMGKKVFCAPLLKISGTILPNSIIKTSVS